MHITITSLYGRPVNIVVNGARVTLNGTVLPHDSQIRANILEKADALTHVLETHIDGSSY